MIFLRHVDFWYLTSYSLPMDFGEERSRSFYLDESLVDLEGLPHIIVGTLEFRDPDKSAWDVVQLKKKIGLGPFDEIKWNSNLDAKRREQITREILPVLHQCTGFICIVEGKSKAKAVEAVLRQLRDYCVETNSPSFSVYMDEGIVENHKSFLLMVRKRLSGRPGCIGIQFMNSAASQLIQCCDIFTGLYRTGLRYGLEGDKQIEIEDRFGGKVRSNLLGFIELATRGILWGEYSYESPDQPPAFLDSWDMGFRMFSSIPEIKQKTMGVGLARVYVGPRC